MNNFKILLNHEIYQQIKSFKFVTMLIIAFVVSLSVSYICIDDYKEDYNTYLDEVKRSEEKLKEVYVYSELEVSVFVSPNPLSIFAKGIDDKVGNKAVMSATHYPGIQSTSQKANPFLNLFSNLDVVGVVKLFSIFVILMSAGIIASEREEKILKMVFISNVSRMEYFLAKYMAASVVLFCSVLVIFIIPSLMILIDSSITTGDGFMSGVLLIAVSSFLYVSVFVLLSLLISARSSSSAQAVLVTLFIWLGITFIYPQVTSGLASYLCKSPSNITLEGEVEAIDLELSKSNGNFYVENHPKVMQNYQHTEVFRPEGGRESLGIILSKVGLTEKANFEFNLKILQKVIPDLRERHRFVQLIEEKYSNDMLKQAVLFEKLNFFVPDVCFGKLGEKIAMTHRDQREQTFQDAIKSYYNLLEDYILGKDGFDYAFFTETPKERMKDDFSTYTDEDKKISWNFSPLKTNSIPQFSFRPKIKFSNEIVSLLGINLLLLVFGLVTFYRVKIL